MSEGVSEGRSEGVDGVLFLFWSVCCLAWVRSHCTECMYIPHDVHGMLAKHAVVEEASKALAPRLTRQRVVADVQHNHNKRRCVLSGVGGVALWEDGARSKHEAGFTAQPIAALYQSLHNLCNPLRKPGAIISRKDGWQWQQRGGGGVRCTKEEGKTKKRGGGRSAGWFG